jgi:uncharacterized membrane protein YhaH (DUF805 family)
LSDVSIIDIFDPRGRVNRKGLAVLAAVVMGAQIGTSGYEYLTGITAPAAAMLAVDVVFCWLGIAAISKRMHDLGLSPWRLVFGALAIVIAAVVVACVAVFALGEASVMPGGLGYLILAVVVFAPVIAATIWLHFASGDPKFNRFGPVPGANGFSRPHRPMPSFRELPDGMSAVS